MSDLSRNGGTFMLKEQLENKFKIQIPFMKYYQIISSMKVVSNNIPKNKSTLRDKDNKICNTRLNNLQKLKTQEVDHQFVQVVYKTLQVKTNGLSITRFWSKQIGKLYIYFPQKL